MSRGRAGTAPGAGWAVLNRWGHPTSPQPCFFFGMNGVPLLSMFARAPLRRNRFSPNTDLWDRWTTARSGVRSSRQATAVAGPRRQLEPDSDGISLGKNPGHQSCKSSARPRRAARDSALGFSLGACRRPRISPPPEANIVTVKTAGNTSLHGLNETTPRAVTAAPEPVYFFLKLRDDRPEASLNQVRNLEPPPFPTQRGGLSATPVGRDHGTDDWSPASHSPSAFAVLHPALTGTTRQRGPPGRTVSAATMSDVAARESERRRFQIPPPDAVIGVRAPRRRQGKRPAASRNTSSTGAARVMLVLNRSGSMLMPSGGGARAAAGRRHRRGDDVVRQPGNIHGLKNFPIPLRARSEPGIAGRSAHVCAVPTPSRHRPTRWVRGRPRLAIRSPRLFAHAGQPQPQVLVLATDVEPAFYGRTM